MAIGAFSELTGLSIDALRHYHEIGILEPAEIDAATGYRRYDVGQVRRARRIRDLRSVDLPLDLVEAVLVATDAAAVLAVLVEHRRTLDRRARDARALVGAIDHLIERERTVPATSEDLRAELLSMLQAQQATSQALFDETRHLRPDRYLFEIEASQRPAGYADAARQSHEHALRLAAIVTAHGWPDAALVGEDGAAAAWAIAQHADVDNELCTSWLPLLRESVASGGALPLHYAALADRVLLRDGRPQRFGTVLEAVGDTWHPRPPVETPAELDDRRAELGLEPVAAYIAALPSPDAWYETEAPQHA